MKPGSIVRAVFLLLCLVWASPGAAGAQTTTGRIEGYVRDLRARRKICDQPWFQLDR